MERLILITKGTNKIIIGVVFENTNKQKIVNIDDLKSLVQNKIIITRNWDKQILKQKYNFDLDCIIFKDLVYPYFKDNTLSRYQMAVKLGFKINDSETSNPIATGLSLWKILNKLNI